MNFGIENKLKNLSDTDIMMNFLEMIEKIYPNLIRINAHCYDSWDSIIEPLYYTAVFETFAWKYGIKIEKGNCHVYENEILTGAAINHIECLPKKYPLICESHFQEPLEFSEEFLSDKKIVFICFSDGQHFTTGPITDEEASKMIFSKVSVQIVADNGNNPILQRTLFIDIRDIKFEFIAMENY